MKNIIKKVPVPLAGLMLALATTGNLVLSYGTIYRNIFGFISALILILLIMKIFIDSEDILESLKNPVIAGVSPTFSMGLMLLSTYLSSYFPSIAFRIWTFSLLLHCFLIIFFTVKFIFNFKIKNVFPSHFVVYVGIVVASITSPTFGLANIGEYTFWFGFILYLCLLPLVLYRVFVVKLIPEPVLPTITILAAPASLCLAGYIASFQQKNLTIIGFLSSLSLAMFLGVLLYLPKMLKVKFYPSYPAFTFPLAISAVAMKQLNGLLIKLDKPIFILKYLVKFQELLTILVVLYVLIKYIKFIFIKSNMSNNLSAAKSP